jgi:signal transduction histidine kinase
MDNPVLLPAIAMFALDDEVTQMEALLTTQDGHARLDTLVALAWHLRQRDPRRALVLVDEANAWLADSSPDGGDAMMGRLLLVAAEVNWLNSELELAQTMVGKAVMHFDATAGAAAGAVANAAAGAVASAVGLADANWALALIANDRGQSDQSDAALVLAASWARQAGDAVRVDVIEATLAFLMTLRDCPAACAHWQQRFHDDMPKLHPAAEARVCDFLGLAACLSSDFGKAAMYFARTHEAAQKSGQIRRSIFATVNVGDAFTSLNDHHAALDWMQRGLDQARKVAWNGSIGVCLMQMAQTQRRLGRLNAAHELLQEALPILASLPDSRNYAVALSYMADLALDQGQFQDALQRFKQLEVRGLALHHLDLQMDAWRGQAHALSQLGQVREALLAAERALQLTRSKNDASRQVSTLIVLSEIHERHGTAAGVTTGLSENPVLFYLQQALELANTIAGYTIPGELLDSIARQYARVGDFTQAYKISLAAIASREKTHSQQATNRAIAMQVRHQTERAQAEREHHRELALSEAQRVQVLHQNSITLERLGAIGQEITAQLDTLAVLAALNRHVHGLLDINAFAIWLLDADARQLQLAFAIEGGKVLDAPAVAVDDPLALTARCVRERCEILRDDPATDERFLCVPGTRRNATALFLPLSISERVLGVVSIQSLRQNAFGERERLIFRTLCAYGAIALDNASAYRQLQQTQAQLVAQEKLAALGSLVAGVAHELNTPIGNSLMMASALLEKTDAIETRVNAESLLYSELNLFLQDAQEASAVIMRGLSSAAELVNSFKQVAMDRTTAQRRHFNLAQTSGEIIATLTSQIRLSGHSMELDIPDDLVIDGYPGPYGQVITNFINNALLHAFDGKKGGHMCLSARLAPDSRVRITFADDGVGISAQSVSHIFDPFFTTKMGQGGNGLGLYISYNIVTSLLNGQIDVISQPGQGCRFVMDLPLQVAELAAA